MSLSYKLLAGKFYRKENGELKRYSRGEIIQFESKDKIPEAILTRIELLGKENETDKFEVEMSTSPNVGLRIKKIEDDKYDVVNENTQQPINDVPLKADEAINLTSNFEDILEIGGDNLDTIVIKDNLRGRKKKNREQA